jgi:hypothetical protein
MGFNSEFKGLNKVTGKGVDVRFMKAHVGVKIGLLLYSSLTSLLDGDE